MGYPLLVKAVLGGGGKGMKLAREPSQFLVRFACCIALLPLDLIDAVSPVYRPICLSHFTTAWRAHVMCN